MPQTNRNRSSSTRQLRYYNIMKARGFTRHTVFIHEKDKDEIMELIKARKDRRLSELNEQEWL